MNMYSESKNIQSLKQTALFYALSSMSTFWVIWFITKLQLFCRVQPPLSLSFTFTHIKLLKIKLLIQFVALYSLQKGARAVLLELKVMPNFRRVNLKTDIHDWHLDGI